MVGFLTGSTKGILLKMLDGKTDSIHGYDENFALG